MSTLNDIIGHLKTFFSSVGKQDSAPLFHQPLSDQELTASMRAANPTTAPTSRPASNIQTMPIARAADVPSLTPNPTPPPVQATPLPSPAPMQAGGAGISGFSGPANSVGPYKDAIINAARAENIDPGLLTALLFQESSLQPHLLNSGGDRGIAQINTASHPDVSDAQAYDPTFAIPFAARLIKRGIDAFGGDINRGVASYNVGQGGARVKGPAPFGGGPRGQAYLDAVSSHLNPDARKRLGLITSPSN